MQKSSNQQTLTAKMKTAREMALDIMKERTTKETKREKLLKIGLTENDISTLFFTERMVRRQGLKAAAADKAMKQKLASYTFGVEIECYNARPADLINAATQRGIQMRHEGYNHVDSNTYYKLVSDGSIVGNNPIECVSPILNGNNGGLDTLKVCCDSLNAVGAMVNKSTGLHVHVGGEINTCQYANVFTNYYYLENVIDSFMAPSRRSNRYAKRMNGAIDEQSLLRAYSYEDVCRVMSRDRYYKVNCMSWSRHHTIEFRQHQGTTDYEKISNWARFCVKLVHWSDNNVLTSHVASIDDIAFLTDEEKTFFKNRAAAFASRNQ